MITIKEPSRETAIIAEADVVVAGGGPGGLPAAIAAARAGASVLLLERYGFLGGLATAGLVALLLGHTASRSQRPIVGELLEELVERMHALRGAPSWKDACIQWGIRFDAETLKYVADEMISEAGVEVLLHSQVVDVMLEDGRIGALIIESKSGRQAVAGKVVVDATGDADVACHAGAPTEIGRDYDGSVQAMASLMHIGGAERVSEDAMKEAQHSVEKALVGGRLRLYHPFFNTGGTWFRDHFAPCMSRQAGDPTDIRDLTRAEMGGRREAWKLIQLLRQEAPGFEDAHLRATPPQIGVMESRRAMADYVLTADDVLHARKHADAVARGSWWIDIHYPRGLTYPVQFCETGCPEGEACPYWSAAHDVSMYPLPSLYPPDDDWFDIPYRCLTPKQARNLLVAGRCISATHEGMAAARVMGTCIAVGQAAGTAAALAVRHNVDPPDVGPGDLRAALLYDGALV